MPAIRITGMASGLPPNIVDQLVEVEKIPIKTIEAKKTKEDDKLKLVSELETKVQDITKNMSELVGIKGFNNSKIISGDPNVIDGTVDPQNAVTGQWQVEVLQLAQKPGAMSGGFPDKDKTEVGVGYIKFETPTGTKEVYIKGGNTTLEGVANSINQSGVGLRASVVNDYKDKENPFKLMVSGLATGDNSQISFPTVYLLDGDQDFYFDQSMESHNAKVKVDGFEFEVPDNQIKDIIPGTTLNLKQAAVGRPILVNVKEDLEVIGGKIKGFVDAYNAALTFIQNQHKMQKGPDGKERLGPLGGDGLARTVENNLRRAIVNPVYGVDSSITRVNELGIEFTRNGTLNFSQDKFNAMLSKNPQDVAKFLRGDGFQVGFVPTVKREITGLVDQGYGPLSNRKRGLQSKIEAMNKQIENKTRQVEKKEESLRQKFADLESKMSKLNQQGSAVGTMGQGQKQG